MADRSRLADRAANLYEYLQVSPRADSGVIHAAYRALARQYHPDVNGSGQASRIMREINAAYHVLGDPVRRARYDAHRTCFPVRRNGRRPSGVHVPPAGIGSRRADVPVRPISSMPHTSGGVRPVVAAMVFCLMIVGALVLALTLVLTSLDDRPPNTGGLPLTVLELRGGGGSATALDRR